MATTWPALVACASRAERGPGSAVMAATQGGTASSTASTTAAAAARHEGSATVAVAAAAAAFAAARATTTGPSPALPKPQPPWPAPSSLQRRRSPGQRGVAWPSRPSLAESTAQSKPQPCQPSSTRQGQGWRHPCQPPTTTRPSRPSLSKSTQQGRHDRQGQVDRQEGERT